MEELFDNLDEDQQNAVTATEGCVRVIAGAGSGKTRALAHRFAWLVLDLGILPSHILCVTFTNKSANEMRQRIHNLTGDNDTGYINTFHGFCVSVLKEDSHAIRYPKNFLVLDNSDVNDMLKVIYEEKGLTLRDMSFSAARDMIEILKTIERPDYYEDMLSMSLEALHDKYRKAEDPRDAIFYGYLYQEKKCFALDYNDLIKFTLYMFEQNEEIRLKWQKRLEYIMIDEFQDIDALQYELMRVLCGYHRNLFVVGDPDQTIYSWRGANVRYLMEFEQKFPHARTVMMPNNYRSTPEIVAAANSLIGKNKYRIPKELKAIRRSGERVLCHHADTPAKEAEWIADKVQELHESGVPYREMTILYRAHYVTRSIEEVFLKKELPYTIYSGVQFLDRMEIKDALAYLRMIIFRDDLSFRRVANVPKRNLGEKRMKFLEMYAAEHGCTLFEALEETLEEEIFRGTKAADFVKLVTDFSRSYKGVPVSDVFSALMNESGYEAMLRTEGNQDRLDNLAELKQSIYDYEMSCGEETDPEDYLQHVALFSNVDAAETGDKVRMMTVHSAKGLEFSNVFLCGMNEGIFPSRKIKDENGMEEERRLAFVALTRAEDRLFITDAEGRNFDGSPRYPSRFVIDIGRENLEFTEEPRSGLIEETLAYVRMQNRRMAVVTGERFRVGDAVMHAAFGKGIVTALSEEEAAYTIRFEKLGTERMISYRARLTPAE